jgi:hypothetical protein
VQFVVPNMGRTSRDWPRESQFPVSGGPCAWGSNKERIRGPEEVKSPLLGLSGGSGIFEGHL